MVSFLANTHASARNEVDEFEKRINQAKEELIRIAEEKKQAQLAMIQKQKDQKNAKGKGKGKKEDDVPLTAEVPKETPKPKTAEPERELDLTVPEDFAEMLRLKIPRPFTFGPILLDGLDKNFDMEAAYDLIMGTLEQRTVVGEENFFIHGLSILAKGRTLKRSSTLLKHARFLNNLQVVPNYPDTAPMEMDDVMEDNISEP